MTAPYELWIWLVEEQDGREGSIAAYVLPGEGPMVLQARTRAYAEKVRHLARAHAEASGNPVRLAHLVEVAEPDEAAEEDERRRQGVELARAIYLDDLDAGRVVEGHPDDD